MFICAIVRNLSNVTKIDRNPLYCGHPVDSAKISWSFGELIKAFPLYTCIESQNFSFELYGSANVIFGKEVTNDIWRTFLRDFLRILQTSTLCIFNLYPKYWLKMDQYIQYMDARCIYDTIFSYWNKKTDAGLLN